MRERGTPDAHVDELASQHLRNAARAAFDLWQARGFAHLSIGAPDAIASELEGNLHPYLKERLTRRLHVGVGASHGEVLAAAEALEAEVERTRATAMGERLRAEEATGRRRVAAPHPADVMEGKEWVEARNSRGCRVHRKKRTK